MHDVFISYSRKDQATARKLERFFDSEGWDVWWDQDIRAGRRWNDELITALNQSRAIVILWSENSVKSEWVKKEAAHGYEHNKLFSVLLEECDVPDPFPEIQWVKLFGWKGEADHPDLGRLAQSLAERAAPSRIDTLRSGFNSRFLGEDRRAPWPNVFGTARQLHYLHFSVVMNPSRRLAWYVAYNTDMDRLQPDMRRSDRWIPDPLVSAELQPANKHYKGSGYDRGHLAPRYLLSWGEPREAQIASHQAFFWTNISPQHRLVNRANYLAVERWERAMAEKHRRLVGFAGPAFRDDDPPFRDDEPGDDGFVAHGTYSIPQSYWKVVAALNDKGHLAHRAFWFENPAPDKPLTTSRSASAHAIDIAELAQRTGLEFPAELLSAPVLEG